jgi:hypothetical protein
MKPFFNYIKARINTDVPAIKTVRMWNNQFLHSNGPDDIKKNTGKYGYRDEKAFAYPACFVEFIVNDIQNYCLGIKDYNLTARFRFGVESYKFERLDTFDFKENFDAFIQLMAPTTVSGMTFTTFQESFTEFDEDWTNVEAPYVDYRVRLRLATAYQRKTDVIASGVNPLVIGIITEPDTSGKTFDNTSNKFDSSLITMDAG